MKIDIKKDFAVFIIAHGRPEITYTYDLLKDCGYTGKTIFLIDDEDKRAQDYYRKHGKEKVYMFSKSEVAKNVDSMINNGNRKAALFARNVLFDVAKKLGYKYFLVLDDDYYYFGHRGDNGAKKTKCLDKVFSYFVKFLATTPTMAIAFSQGGDHIGGWKGDIMPIKRKCMNSWFCAVNKPFKFYGIMNDDVNAYLRNGYIGGLFFTYNRFQLDQFDTQALKGGMTDIYAACGTYQKSFFSVMLNPAVVKIKLMGMTSPRLHHSIHTKKAYPCIIRQDFKK